MGRKIGIIVLSIVLGTLAVAGAVFGTAAAVAAIKGHNAPAQDSSRPTPPPATVTFNESEYSIVTPNGWTRKDVTSNADAEKAIRYEAADGNYFIVNMDPLGSDFTYDALWNYSVSGLKFAVAKKHDCANTVDEPCPDDAKFHGYIMWKTGTTPAGGHVFYFQFGNSKTASADQAVAEQILTSITVKA
jgi:hypothetical protein